MTRVLRGVGLMAGVCTIALATSAEAQVQSFKIPAGMLQVALDEYVRQSGTQLVYRVDELAAAHSPGVQGTITPEAALQALLAGSGFEERRDISGAVAIVSSRSSSKPPVSPSKATRLAFNVPAAQPSVAASDAVEANEAGEIVVTARKRAETLLAVPVTVTAVAAKTMSNLGIHNLRLIHGT